MLEDITDELVVYRSKKSGSKTQSPDYAKSIIVHTNMQVVMIAHKQFKNINPFMQWEQYYKIAETAKDKIISISVTWSRPKPEFYKLNIDGYTKGNLGPSGGGGILKDENG
ncbi:hypothetical protein HAX54_016587 [Datura stramonium]|uniref:Uncharacterized protein n=1 Tax=Datura stramonium TaxID=4076 RepID=A0ABS8UJA1_DATST|nr:hypothetical protein [Datura stramonium]